MIRYFLIIICFVFFSSPVLASEEGAVSVPFEKFRAQDWSPRILMKYAPDQNQDNRSILFSPYPYHSLEQAQEVEYVKTVTKARTDQQEKTFEAMNDDPLEHLLSLLDIDDENFIETRLLLISGLEALNKKIWEEKWRYQRLRPTQFDARIDSLRSLPESASYPAEKAAQARMVAHILAEVFPDHDYVWMGWADQVGKLYEIAGLQFPTDTKAGQDLADHYYKWFSGDIEFKNLVLNSNIEMIDFTPNVQAVEALFGTMEKPKKFP